MRDEYLVQELRDGNKIWTDYDWYEREEDARKHMQLARAASCYRASYRLLKIVTTEIATTP